MLWTIDKNMQNPLSELLQQIMSAKGARKLQKKKTKLVQI